MYKNLRFWGKWTFFIIFGVTEQTAWERSRGNQLLDTDQNICLADNDVLCIVKVKQWQM